jgi:hypothetical protein
VSAAIRLIVTVILVIWALVDAVLSAKQMPTLLSAIAAFGISAFESLVFIALVFVIWEWVERRVGRKKIAVEQQELFPKLSPESKKRKQWTVAIFVLGVLLSLYGWGFGLIMGLVLLVRSAKYLSSENQEGSHLGLYLGVILLMADCLLWFVIRR